MMDAKQMTKKPPTRNITAAKVKTFLEHSNCQDIVSRDHDQLVTFTYHGERCEARLRSNGRWIFILLDLELMELHMELDWKD